MLSGENMPQVLNAWVGVLNNSIKVFWEFGSIIMHNASDILFSFCYTNKVF